MMIRRHGKKTLLLLLPVFALVLLGGCAGPTSPFGALDSFKQVKNLFLSKDDQDQSVFPKSLRSPSGDYFEFNQNDTLDPSMAFIRVSPDRQITHKTYDLMIHVYDPYEISQKQNIAVKFNGINLTSEFLKMAVIYSPDLKNYYYKVPQFKLSPKKSNKIQFTYSSKRNGLITSDYKIPYCPWSSRNEITDTENFKVPPSLLGMLNEKSLSRNMNPALITALIAQESGFNQKAVSYSKAIGLTQITPLAESQVINFFPNFPRHPGINNLSFFSIKSLIALNQINPQNEWRLDTESSIMGGLTYLEFLKNYWDKKDLDERIKSFTLEPELENEKIKLILASYNSGFTRVRQATGKLKQRWAMSRDLNEARRYVNLVTSYCYAFSNNISRNHQEVH